MSDQFIPANSAAPQGFNGEGGSVRLSVRDKIMAVSPYSAKTIHVDEWDADIEIRSLSLFERNDMLNKAKGDDGKADADISVIYPELIMRTAFDPATGEKVFAEDDAAFINSLPANLMDKLAIPAMQLSGMADNTVDEAAKKSSETEVSE